MSGRYAHCPKKDFPDTNHGAQAMSWSSRRSRLLMLLVLIAEQAGEGSPGIAEGLDIHVPVMIPRGRMEHRPPKIPLCYPPIPNQRGRMEQGLLCRLFDGIIQYQCEDCPEDCKPDHEPDKVFKGVG